MTHKSAFSLAQKPPSLNDLPDRSLRNRPIQLEQGRVLPSENPLSPGYFFLGGGPLLTSDLSG